MKFLISTVLVAYLFCLHYGCEALAVADSPQISSADVKPQINAATVIAGLQTVGAIMKVARELVNKTTFKDIAKLHVVPYHSELAASYGKLNAESVKDMDDELKVMIAAVDRKLTKLHEKNKDGNEILFDDYVATMMQNPLIEKDFDGEIFRDQYKQFSRFGFAKNGINKQVVNEVETWFLNLIDDSDVLASTKINILDFGNIVGCTDAAVEDLQTLFLRNEQVERSILEVGVLRYPDLDNPFFKVTTFFILSLYLLCALSSHHLHTWSYETRVPGINVHYANPLDLFLTSCPEKGPLNSSNYCRSILALLTNRKHDPMYHFKGPLFGALKLAGTSSGPTLQKLSDFFKI